MCTFCMFICVIEGLKMPGIYLLTARALGWGWMFFSFLVLALIFAFWARCRVLATNFVKKRKEALMMHV